MSRLLSERVKKVPATDVSEDRYLFLKLSEAEPDLGVPPSSGYVLTSTTTGIRSWIPMEGGTGTTFMWIVKNSNYTAIAGDAILANTSAGSFTITLPATPQAGTSVIIADAFDWETNNLTVVAGGSKTIEFTLNSIVLDIKNIKVEFIYEGNTWQVYSSLGKIGFTGSQGATGFTGSQGAIGFTGSQGIGFTGSQGTSGFTGSNGETGFTGSQGATGFTGSQGDVGFTGSQGDVGFVGSQGSVAGANYIFSSNTNDGDLVLPGRFKFNNDVLSNVTKITIERFDANNVDRFNFITAIYGATGTNKGILYVTDNDSQVSLMFNVVGSIFYSGSTTNYFEITVTYNSGTQLPSDSSSYSINFVRIGDVGFTGSRGTTGFTGSHGLLNWVLATSNYTAIAGNAILADTTSGSFTITLPATPTAGQTVVVVDSGNSEVNNLTIARNGSTIEGQAEDLLIDVSGVKIDLVYNGSTWQFFSNVGPEGNTGPIGFTGSFGEIGFTGSQGAVGFTGSAGPVAGTNGQLVYNNNGQAAGTTNLFYSAGNDRIGILTTEPSATLDVAGVGAIKVPVGDSTNRPTPSTGMIRFNTTTTSFEGYTGSAWGEIGGSVSLTNNTTTNANTFYLAMADSQSTGKLSSLTVSSSKLYFNPSSGMLSATDFNSLSDVSFKTDIKPIKNPVDIVNSLEGKSFKWKDSDQESYGLIAQELEKILPELVHINDNGVKTVSYIPLISILLENVKHLNNEVNYLKGLLN